jgi:hypothetical protein
MIGGDRIGLSRRSAANSGTPTTRAAEIEREDEQEHEHDSPLGAHPIGYG